MCAEQAEGLGDVRLKLRVGGGSGGVACGGPDAAPSTSVAGSAAGPRCWITIRLREQLGREFSDVHLSDLNPRGLALVFRAVDQLPYLPHELAGSAASLG